MIDRARLAALVTVLAAAAAGTAYELSPGPTDSPVAAPTSRTAPPATPTSRAEAVTAWAADILARPLIYPGRHAPAPITLAEQQPAPEPAPRLTGILVGPNWRRAMFVTAPGARPTSVPEGARIGAYTVRSISAGEVTLDGPDGPHALHPSHEGTAAPNFPDPPLPRRA